jgi:hypothetical protein
VNRASRLEVMRSLLLKRKEGKPRERRTPVGKELVRRRNAAQAFIEAVGGRIFRF